MTEQDISRGISVTCGNGHVFRAKAKYSGRRGVCPVCRTPVEVPAAVSTLHDAAEISTGRGDEKRTKERPTSVESTGEKSRQLGRFSILAILGEGAFGTVYKAHDPQLDREVAIKVPRLGALLSAKDTERFLREARAAAQLRHPNIVPIFDAGELNGSYYIASAFIPPGTTLRDRIRKDVKFDQRIATQMIERIALALHYAHSQGIVHRDVKPDNILLDRAGVPHVADFGLARRDEGEVLMTQDGSRMGTPAYMSPELHRGKSHEVDGRSDLWALGVMLYDSVLSLDWSPDGKFLISSSADKTCRVWAMPEGKCVATLRGHLGIVSAAAWHPVYNRVATASTDKTVRIWEPLSGAEVMVVSEFKAAAEVVQWSPSGQCLALGTHDGEIEIIDSGMPPRKSESIGVAPVSTASTSSRR